MANQEFHRFASRQSTGKSEGLVGSVEQFGSSVAEKVEEGWNAARCEAEHLAGNVRQTAEGALREVNQFVHRYPLAVFFGGFAVGFLVRQAFLSSRSDMTSRMSRYSA